ncbi:MAG: L,D-transpeptidase family protein [Acidimicrobiales bacterium]
MGRSTRVMMVSLGASALLLAGCSGSKKQAQTPVDANGPGAEEPPVSFETPTTAAPTIPTTIPTTTTTLPPAIGAAGNLNIVRELAIGITGEDVKAVEQRLSDLKFSTGPIDGKYDAKTGQAVLSFQKQTGLPRTSKVNAATATRMNTAGFGTPMVSDGNPDRVEVDLSRQVLQIWRGGQLFRVLGVSTGTGKRYCDTTDTGKRVCGIATTPTGRFDFSRRIEGKRKSDLGVLFDPMYFTGGYAVHGSPSVPASPASHGCVRIPLWESKFFFNEVPLRTQMVVIKDGAPPVPTLAAPVVGEPPTSTTVPAVTTPTTAATTTTRPAVTTTTSTTVRTTPTTRSLLG